MTSSTPVAPGATIGILGGGQLARMLALAAARLGLKTHVFAREPESCAFEVAAARTVAAYDDEPALERFAADVAVVTYEFENVPAETAAFLRARIPVRPEPEALATTQDRLTEKNFVSGLGIATAPYLPVDDLDALAGAVAAFGRPCILKARRFGYDGKGQVRIQAGDDLAAALASLQGSPAILEGLVPFAREVSVVAARGLDGAFRAYDVCENVHEHHILSMTSLPAVLSDEAAAAAIALAQRIADALGYVGVLAVEMFVVEPARAGQGSERLIVNEIAPRVHNSGHWTIDGAVTSQFEQHVRAVVGWPLGSTHRHGAVEMRNLIGEDVDRWPALIAEEGACVHLYAKGEARPGRKMGHVTRLLRSPGL